MAKRFEYMGELAGAGYDSEVHGYVLTVKLSQYDYVYLHCHREHLAGLTIGAPMKITVEQENG